MTTIVQTNIVTQQLITVLAIRVDEYDLSVTYNNTKITVRALNNITKLTYTRILKRNCQYWNCNCQYFKNDFLLFGYFLKHTLQDKIGQYYFNLNDKNSDLTVKIIETQPNLIIKLNIYLSF
jgi:hypothetical protein